MHFFMNSCSIYRMVDNEDKNESTYILSKACSHFSFIEIKTPKLNKQHILNSTVHMKTRDINHNNWKVPNIISLRTTFNTIKTRIDKKKHSTSHRYAQKTHTHKIETGTRRRKRRHPDSPRASIFISTLFENKLEDQGVESGWPEGV